MKELKVLSRVSIALLVFGTVAMGGIEVAWAGTWSPTKGDVIVTSSGEVYDYSPTGTELSSLAVGGTSDALYDPIFDSNLNMYVPDNNGIVYKVTPSGSVSSFVSTGLSNLESIAFDSNGNLWAAGDSDLYEYDSAGNPVLDSSNNPVHYTGHFGFITVGSDGHTLYSVTASDVNVYSFNLQTGTSNGIFYSFTAHQPWGVRALPDGGVLVATSATYVDQFDSAGTLVGKYTYSGASQLLTIHLSPDGTHFWGADYGNNDVAEWNLHSSTSSFGIDSTPVTKTPFTANPPTAGNLWGAGVDGAATAAAPVNAATPSITKQPQATTVNVGGSASLSVAATVSDSGTLSYQWYSNTTNSTSGGSKLTGATSTTYSAPTTAAGATYYYCVVTNTNSGATGNKTATVTSDAAKVTVLLNAPSNLQHSQVSSTGWTESWTGVSGATSYNVYVDGTKVNTSAVTGTSYDVTGETANTPYSVTVTAVNAGGESSKSSADSVTTLPNVPGVPTGLSHTNVAQTSWTESWTGVSGATSYNVYVDGTKVNTSAVTGTSYDVTSETANTPYSVTVTAVNAGGESSKSSADSVTTLPNVPGVPTGLSHTNVAQTSWTESWTGVSGATSYNVYVDGTKVNTSAVTGTSYDVTSETANTPYSVTVTAVNAGGESSKSSADSVTTLPNVPGVPTGLSHTNVAQTSWTETWNPVADASSYDVYLNGLKLGSTVNAVYDFTGEQPGTRYQVSVASVNNGGTSQQSSTDPVTTLYAPTAVPTGLSHSNVTRTSWTETWSPLSDAWSYDVYLNGAKVGSTVNAVYDFTGQQPGTGYQVSVASVNGNGVASKQSNADSVTTDSMGFTFNTSSSITPVGQTLSVAGSVYHQDNQSPWAGVPVTLNASGGSWMSGGHSTRSTVYSVYSDKQGSFQMDWSAPTDPGVYTLSATANGHTESTSVDVAKYITDAVTTNPITTSTSSSVRDTFSNVPNPEQSKSNVEIVIPAGTFTRNTLVWVTTTSGASEITPIDKQVVAAIGVNFSGSQSPQHPITLTIQNSNIESGDRVYKVLSDGTYQQIPASDVTITAGEAVISFTNDPNFIVTKSVGGGGTTPPSILTDRFMEQAEVGQTYSAHIVEMGGTYPLTWSVADGSLPAGLTLNNQGDISGTPKAAGKYTFTVQVADNDGRTSTKKLTLTVNASASTNSSSSSSTGASGSNGASSSGSTAQTLAITTKTVMTPGQPNTAFQQQLHASGGTPPYTWSIVRGTLPAGLKLDGSTGVIHGVTNDTRPHIVTVEATDAKGVKQQEQVVVDTLPNTWREMVWKTPSMQAANVPAIVANNAGTKTTYMPIWYVMQMLKSFGVDSTWNGHDWNMNTAKNVTANPKMGKGNFGIYVNGKLVEKANAIYAKDPNSHNTTTYMPIWYVQQVMKSLGLNSTWNGTTWDITQ